MGARLCSGDGQSGWVMSTCGVVQHLCDDEPATCLPPRMLSATTRATVEVREGAPVRLAAVVVPAGPATCSNRYPVTQSTLVRPRFAELLMLSVLTPR